MQETHGKIAFANTLRGLAALSVMLIHYYSVFWGDPRVIAQLANAPVFSISHAHISWDAFLLQHLDSALHLNFAAFGVALFFLISGFVIPFSFQKMGPVGFLCNRIFRIYPTYFAGFSITLLALYFSGKYFGLAFPYSAHAVFIHYIPGLRDMFQSPPIDGIVWTLEIELKFYVVCALLYVWMQTGATKLFLLPLALGLMSLCVAAFPPVFLAGYWIAKFCEVSMFLNYMFIGVALNFYFRKKLRAEVLVFLIALLFMAFACLWQKTLPAQFYEVWSYGLACVVFTGAMAFPALCKSNPITNFFAAISYPLYVIHAIAGYVAIRILLDLKFPAWLAVLTTTLGIFALAFLIHKLVELPTQKFGRKLAAVSFSKENSKMEQLRTGFPPARE